MIFHKEYRRPGSKIPDFDNVNKERLVVFSSPERAAEIFHEYEAIGITTVICMVNFGGAPVVAIASMMNRPPMTLYV
jgi:hypothetical protein